MALALAGCATGSLERSAPVARQSLAPAGPGHVFATAEMAALDALAFSHLAAQQQRDGRDLARAGTVYPVAGGFSYDTPVAASDSDGRLRYRMGAADVLHYRYYAASAWNASGAAALRLPDRARAFVDRWDPGHRPIYFMTPDRHVRVYSGRAEGERKLARIARSSERSAEQVEVAWLAAPATAPAAASGLALRPEAGVREGAGHEAAGGAMPR